MTLDGGTKTIEVSVPINVGVDDTGHDVKFFAATAGSYMLWDESHDRLQLTDSTSLYIGDGGDMLIYHDGSNSYLTNATGALKIATETSGIAVSIGHTTSETTVNDNLNVTGNIACTGNITGQDNDYILLGAGTDLQLFHNGTASAIGNITGDLYIINSANDKDILFQCDNGSGSATTYFTIDGSAADGTLTYTKWVDNGIIALGAGTDLKLWHNGTNSYIKNETGSFNIVQAVDDGDLVLKCDNGSGGTTAYLTLDGSAGTIVTAKSVEITGGITTSVGFNFGNCAAVYMQGLPSSDPVEAGRVWRSEEGYLLVSAGEGG
jgi:hypothetical protein